MAFTPPEFLRDPLNTGRSKIPTLERILRELQRRLSGSNYIYGGRVYFTSSGSFAKGDYPGLRAVMVEVQGGGGAGGGTTATSGAQNANGSGGAGGGYAEKFILVASLGTSETVTVGGGGAGSSGSDGGDGSDTTFGSHATGAGGNGGIVGTATASSLVRNGTVPGGGTGDLVIPGSPGGAGTVLNGQRSVDGQGGDSHLGSGGRIPNNSAGVDGSGYGGGGSASNRGASGSAASGGDGADGIVIVELYY